MSRELALVAEFDNEREAMLVAGMLENNGIEATVDGNIMSTLYAAGATWSPVRLYVPADRLAEARSLLEAHRD